MGKVAAVFWGWCLSSTLSLAGAPSDGDMQTMLDNFCTQCHNTQHAKAGVALDTLAGAKAAAKKAVDILKASKMPPAQATQPPADDHEAMLAWFQAQPQ